MMKICRTIFVFGLTAVPSIVPNVNRPYLVRSANIKAPKTHVCLTCSVCMAESIAPVWQLNDLFSKPNPQIFVCGQTRNVTQQEQGSR